MITSFGQCWKSVGLGTVSGFLPCCRLGLAVDHRRAPLAARMDIYSEYGVTCLEELKRVLRT
jgi:hypothetical protein